MDTIEFVRTDRELGAGSSECVEIVINGRNLFDYLRDVEAPFYGGVGGYAGLPPYVVFAQSSRFLDIPDAMADVGDPAHEHPDADKLRRTFILRCSCGDALCSYVLARIRVSSDQVTWSDIEGSHKMVPRDAYLPLGPFEFDRGQYEGALGINEA